MDLDDKMTIIFTNLEGMGMAAITGYLDVTINKKNGEKEEVSISGEEFGLEEGGDWHREDDAYVCGFLFIAFCEGFDAILSFNLVENELTHYELSFRINDEDIKSVRVDENELDVSPCLRS
jgi:hypothetical protein